MASNKRTLSKHEFVKWAEFFEWEQSQRTKEENYLAKLVYILGKQVFKDSAEMKDCFCPPLTEKELAMANRDEKEQDSVLSPEDGWNALAAMFGTKKGIE